MSLNNSKAKNIYDQTTMFLKEHYDVFLPLLHRLINLCIQK